MRKKKLIWKLFPSYLVLIFFCILGVAWYSIHYFESFYIRDCTGSLEKTANLLKSEIRQKLIQKDYDGVQEYCRLKSAHIEGEDRITVILPDGKVVGDTRELPSSMENHANRPEIKKAYDKQVGASSRESPTLGINMRYVAIPLMHQDEVIGVLRTSVSLTSIEKTVQSLSGQILFAGVIAVLFAAGLCFFIARRIAGPLEALKRISQKFAEGDLTPSVVPSDTEEVWALSESINRMASELQKYINEEREKHNELLAILSSMIEGVLAVDENERIINMNAAAAKMLNIENEDVKGRPVQEVLRRPPLHRIITEALKYSKTIEKDIVIYREQEHFLQAHAALLYNAQGRKYGVVVVLNDVTRIRKLENIRQEFVANVSHELKTPITSIKGFVETLQAGAKSVPEDNDKFLSIIARQTNRLYAIIEDLLVLSRLEQSDEAPSQSEQNVELRSILHDAIEVCNPKAKDKNIAINVECDPQLTTRLNSALLEQAIVNLVDNAVKYSPEGEPVEVQAKGFGEKGGVMIKIIDHGSGIAKQHIPRLFERFYRVDKARSRQLGGTGLGLAIVKHIVQNLGGQVSVDSEVGKGSAFTLIFPPVAVASSSQ